MQRTRLAHYLYTASLFFLILLTGVCIAISAVDVIIQAHADRTESGDLDYRNLIVVGAGYVLLAIVSLSFSCSRVMTVRASLQDIPKIYIPIKKDDLPKKVYTHIQRQLEDTKRIRVKAEPRPEDINQVGWARPGNVNFEGVDFKRAIARSPVIIEQAAIQISEEYTRPTYLSVRQYIEFLIQQALIDAQLGHGYVEGYETARFSTDPVGQEKYYDIMKHLAAILHHMGYRLHAVQTDRQNINSSARGDDGDGVSSASSQRVTASHRRSTDLNQQCRQEPHDDDVVSLAQSMATWTSRSTQSRQNRSRRSRLRSDHQDENDEAPYGDDNYEDHNEHLQQAIYSRLMWGRSVK